jgi:hypothetical protein
LHQRKYPAVRYVETPSPANNITEKVVSAKCGKGHHIVKKKKFANEQVAKFGESSLLAKISTYMYRVVHVHVHVYMYVHVYVHVGVYMYTQ